MDDGALRALVRDVPDFPQPGILFKDLTPVFADPEAFTEIIDRIVAHLEGAKIDVVVGVEARGFLLAAPVADRLGVGIVPVRKEGKLPRETHAVEYALEYGSATLELHTDAFAKGRRVAIIDDVIATGGTMAATVSLVEAGGGHVAALACVVELDFLNGREALDGRDLFSILRYGGQD